MQSATALKLVEEGMKVFDSNRNAIGTVEYVQFGDDDPSTPQLESVSVSDPRDRRRSLIDNIADAFTAGDNIPDEIRERLLHQGFVRIDADGIFEADRYVTPEQIDSVSNDGLMLNVTKEQLVKH
jgi:hypothetical protein